MATPSDAGPLTLDAASLFSKWGFGDGEALSDWWWDEFDQPPPPTADLPQALRNLVAEHLLPLIGGQFTVVDISTSHNPIRISSWRGQPWDDHADGPPPDFIPVAIAVPAEVVVAAVRATADTNQKETHDA